jgi:hypothetical protein
MIIKNVVGASRYSFEDKDSKRLVEGVNVFFLQDASNQDQIGQITSKVSLPISAWGGITQIKFPSDCEAFVEQQFTSKGIKSKVTSLKALALSKF